MISVSFGAMSALAMAFGMIAIPIAAIWLVGKVLGLVFTVVGGVLGLAGGLLHRVGGFLRAELVDSLHLVGGLLTGVVIAPLALANLVIGRLRSARHYGRALEDELTSTGISLYRIALGHPVRLLGLGALTEGLERRLPDLISRAPRPQPRRGGQPSFEGYKITGTLAAGGSGARLFLARPQQSTVRRYLEAGHADPGQVVIKSFALEHGSTLPQIVRESRALEAAKRLGLVLDHELAGDHFWYAMPFVPGEDLDLVTRRLHARSGPEGLDPRALAKVTGYATDVLATLDRFHRGGLWHKDIKPSNLIVSGDRVHLVDLGLVTPLASAMTLTTHGTEFFRDPELVRLAMKGVKVHEVDGAKFDIYSSGAVLYSMIENSFPAHGSLSRITKRCPDALAWIVRRAMADIDQRYASAEEMGRDLTVILAADDPFTVKPADLPSMGGIPPRAAAAAWKPASPERRFPLESLAPAAAPLFGAPPPRGGTPVPDTDKKVRRRARRGVLAGLCLGCLGFMLIGGALTAHGAWRRAPVSVVTDGWWHFPASRAPRVEASASASLSSRSVRLSPDLKREWQRTRARGSGPRDTVLLLTDLAIDSGSREIERLCEKLSREGFRVLGHKDDGGEPETLDLIAGARRAVELGTPDDGEAHARLQTYLNGTSDLDAIIWLAPGSREGSISMKTLVRSHR